MKLEAAQRRPWKQGSLQLVDQGAEWDSRIAFKCLQNFREATRTQIRLPEDTTSELSLDVRAKRTK